ncbi:MAG: ABC transporter ATP-binding protein [Syntrophorhabdaceae bacterium]|nr:ABC transporter ATP-binding protein [Syntrophorhabdaceae bacterium]
MFLEVKGLHVSYGDIEAVSGVDFYLEKGELVSIIGANGAGKTTILNCVMGIIPPKEGAIIFKGKEITGIPDFERARMGIRIVPERSRVFPRLTVYENLLTGFYRIRDREKFSERLSWLYEVFPVLRNRQGQLASTLSGGEQQQLSIARALISNPELLLVDEVSMGLMPKLVDQVFEILKRLNEEHGLTILLVEQNAYASLNISKRAYVLETGTCVLEGDAHELMSNPEVKEVYLGN